MEILGITLTPKAEIAYNTVINKLKQPVVIGEIDRFHMESNGYILDENGKHMVYVQKQLPQEAFESTLLHELLHCIQGEEGSKGLIPARNGDYAALHIASIINSTVNDIDVEVQLLEMGLHSEYIDHIRYFESKEALDMDIQPKMQEIFNIIGALNLVLINKTCTNQDYIREITKLNKIRQKKVVHFATEIIKIIDKCGYKTPKEQIKSIKRIVRLIGWEKRFKLV